MGPRQAISIKLTQSQSALSSSPLGEARSPIIKRYAQHTPQFSSELFHLLSSPWSDLHAGGVLSGLAPALYFCPSVQVAFQASEAQCRGDRAILTVGCSPQFLPQQFGAVCGNDSSRSSMHLRSRNLPRPSASSPPGNRSHPMANPSQVPDLEGLHRDIHDMAEQMRIMNENNGRLMQLLTAANPPLPTADIKRSRHSVRSGDRSQNVSTDRVRGRRRAPSPSLRERSSSSESSQTRARSKADKYIAAEELAEAKRRRRGKDDHKIKEPDTRRTDYRKETRYKRPDRDPKRSSDRRPHTPLRRLEFILPPLNAPVAQVLSEIKHEEFVKWPGKIKTDPQKRNRNKYCEFHRDHGHNTEDCFQLKEQIADLIKRGYLRKYVAARPSPNSPERRYGDNRPTVGDIQTIHGGGIKAITSTYHLKLKFPTPTGIGEIKGDQKVAKQCFISAMHADRNLFSSAHPIAITEHGRRHRGTQG
ncbi:hypothetical protein Acr_21g0005330 [Actinidia rufa]|uniref:Uncharacterized protein n=1 Tax=Actinidia rufa TaxID=165716 RepID=A0A7J0GGQ6_9ERIC|nr:hypothetical protein Acr_21g0005330 [Actinidia rufa]